MVSWAQFLPWTRAVNVLSQDALEKEVGKGVSFYLALWLLVLRGDLPFLRHVCQAWAPWASDVREVSYGCLRT